MGMIKHGAGTVIGSSETPPPDAKPETPEEEKTEEAETEVMDQPEQGDPAED